MLSQKKGEVLTLEMQQRVVDVWAKFPWWGAEKVWKHLKAQGEHITLEQVRQVARESGWSVLRKALGDIYAISVESFRPRDEWLVKQLLAQVERLVEQLEALGGLTPEEQIERADLEALSKYTIVLSAPSLALGDAIGETALRMLGTGGGWDGTLHLLRHDGCIAQEPPATVEKVRGRERGATNGRSVSLLLPQPSVQIRELHQLAPELAALLQMESGLPCDGLTAV
jgi:hypothetical protein